MANYTAKFSQDTLTAIATHNQSSSSTLSEVFNALANQNNALSAIYSYSSSWNATSDSLTQYFNDGSQLSFKGAAKAAYSSFGYEYGTAHATTRSLYATGFGSETITGDLNYNYTINNGYLNYQFTGGNVRSYRLDLNSFGDMGRGYIQIDGSIHYTSTGDISGTLNSFSQGGSNILQSAVLSGDFNVSGNVLTQSIVTGTMTGWDEKYYDGSYSTYSGSRHIDSGTKVAQLWEDASIWIGDDNINIDLTGNITSNYQIKSGSGNDIIDLTGGSRNVLVDGGSGAETITLKNTSAVVTGGSGDDHIIDLSGYSIVAYTGKYSEYNFNYNTSTKTLSISDMQNARDGNDSVVNTQSFKFADSQKHLTDILSDLSQSHLPLLELTGTSPDSQTADVYVGSNLTLTFNKSVIPNHGYIHINSFDGSDRRDIDVFDSNQVSFNGTIVTIDPSSDLLEGKTYYVTIDAEAIKDPSGNIFQATSIKNDFVFSTENFEPIVFESSYFGGATEDYLYGNAANNKMEAYDGNDDINGVAGDDYLSGGNGNDRLWGGEGNDTLKAGTGNDYLDGGMGNDDLEGGSGDDRLEDYGNGNDRLTGGDGNDDLNGGVGDDKLDGGTGNDRLWGDVGNDTLKAGSGDDYLDGGMGNDDLEGGSGDDRLEDYGNGNDRLTGGDGNDDLNGGVGDDALDGGNGNDRLWGGAGNDTLKAGSGNDYLDGGMGNDELEGGSGDDRIEDYGNGNDRLTGGDGNDDLNGGVGDDTLDGGVGNDRLWGGEGNDLLIASKGNDSINGDIGFDVAKFSGNRSEYQINKSSSQITITDTVIGRDGADALYSIEKAEFQDGSLNFDTAPTADNQLIYRLYEAAFNRFPDQDGFKYWVSQHDGGMDMNSISQAFVGSMEFISLYGNNVSNSEFVDNLYQNVLGRSPDAEGKDYWTNRLDYGQETHETILIGFANSLENVGGTAHNINDGFWLK